MIAASKEWARIESSVLERLQFRANQSAGEAELNLLVRATRDDYFPEGYIALMYDSP